MNKKSNFKIKLNQLAPVRSRKWTLKKGLDVSSKIIKEVQDMYEKAGLNPNTGLKNASI